MSGMRYNAEEHADQDRAALYARVKELEEWIMLLAYCPCCDLTDVTCYPGCTFAEECPSEAEQMQSAREVLYGTPIARTENDA